MSKEEQPYEEVTTGQERPKKKGFDRGDSGDEG